MQPSLLSQGLRVVTELLLQFLRKSGMIEDIRQGIYLSGGMQE